MHQNEASSSHTSGAGRQRAGRSRPRRRRMSWLAEVLVVLAIALVISTLIRLFIVQVYSIPSSSMENTLQIGDRIAVNRIPGVGKDIGRGDVVVFEDTQGWLPAEHPQGTKGIIRNIGEFVGLLPADGQQVVVKRVIGIGGDNVTCCTAEGQIEINGMAIDEPYLRTPGDTAQIEFDITVPQGSLWVMGDNRGNSSDSRYHIQDGQSPFISKNDVIGKTFGVFWPFSHWSSVGHRGVFDDVPDPQ